MIVLKVTLLSENKEMGSYHQTPKELDAETLVCEDSMRDCFVITTHKMSEEEYDNLPEFTGF